MSDRPGIAGRRLGPSPIVRRGASAGRGRGRLAGAVRLRSRVVEIGHHDDLAVHRAAHDLRHRVGDEGAEPGVDPVLGEVGGDPDRVDAVGEAQARGLAEPDVERALVDLLRDEFESLLPDGVAVASLHGRPSTSLPAPLPSRRAAATITAQRRDTPALRPSPNGARWAGRRRSPPAPATPGLDRRSRWTRPVPGRCGSDRPARARPSAAES